MIVADPVGLSTLGGSGQETLPGVLIQPRDNEGQNALVGVMGIGQNLIRSEPIPAGQNSLDCLTIQSLTRHGRSHVGTPTGSRTASLASLRRQRKGSIGAKGNLHYRSTLGSSGGDGGLLGDSGDIGGHFFISFLLGLVRGWLVGLLRTR